MSRRILLFLAPLALVAAGCHRPGARARASSAATPAPAHAPAGRTLDVVITGTGLGEIDPCG